MKKHFYKLAVNWYQASDKPLPKWLDRACDNDVELSDERSLGTELTDALRKRPNDNLPTAGANMSARVLRQITEEDYLSEKASGSTRSSGSLIRGAGMAFAAIAVTISVIQFTNTDGSKTDGEIQATTVAEQVSPEELIEIGKDWKNPLDQEIEFIVSDAKGAIDFLASNFVPSSYLAKADKA